MANLFDDESKGFLKAPTDIITGANSKLYITGNLVADTERVVLRPSNNVIEFAPISQRAMKLVPGGFTVSGTIEKAFISIGALRLALGKVPETAGEMNVDENYPDYDHNAGVETPTWRTDGSGNGSPIPYYFTLVFEVESGVNNEGNNNRIMCTVKKCLIDTWEVSSVRKDLILENISFKGTEMTYDFYTGT